MAGVMMASSKSLMPLTLPIQRLKVSSSLPKLPQLPKPNQLLPLSSNLKSVSLILGTTLAAPPLSLAEEVQKASLFDFNLTLPIIMAEFLLLMVALDKIYFTPLGKFMDERDANIREKLNSVQDTAEEVKQLEEQAAAVMSAARAEISAAMNKMRKETMAEVEEKLAEGRKKMEAELVEALEKLELQKMETIKALESQISVLSDEIVKKVLPVN